MFREHLRSKIRTGGFFARDEFSSKTRINICYSGILNERRGKKKSSSPTLYANSSWYKACALGNMLIRPTSFCELSIFSTVGSPSRLSQIILAELRLLKLNFIHTYTHTDIHRLASSPEFKYFLKKNIQIYDVYISFSKRHIYMEHNF